MNSAEIDGLIRTNPCRAIKTAAAFRGLSGAPRSIPTEAQILDLFDVVQRRYHAALWLAAGQGCRIGEVLAVEDSPTCIDLDRGELHVRHSTDRCPSDRCTNYHNHAHSPIRFIDEHGQGIASGPALNR